MPQNDFVPFATGPGANVYSTAAYTAMAARQVGVVDGEADPLLANNSWRQGTALASAVGAFIASKGYDALDNGDIGALRTNLEAAIVGSIIKLTPKGQTRTTRFTPNVVLSDLPATNTPYTTQTVTISGASYVVLTSYVGVRNNQSSPTGVISYISNSAGGTSQYLGCVILNGVQIPLPIRATFTGLTPTQTYTFSQVVQKDSAVGPILALDAYLLAEHDGN